MIMMTYYLELHLPHLDTYDTHFFTQRNDCVEGYTYNTAKHDH
jgi:hypothetical protein